MSAEAETKRRAGGINRPDGFQTVSIIVCTIFALICLLPFWIIVAASVTSEAELVHEGYKLWPETFSFDAYRAIFSGDTVAKAYGASLFITIIGTAIAVVVTAGLAYVIALRVPKVSAFMAGMTYIPMLFSGGLVPFYILVTQVLDLQNSLWSVILPFIVQPFLVFIFVAYLATLPRDVLESAMIDGASQVKILFKIVLPMATPMIATVGLFYALAYWNEWFNALLFISDQDKYPLQLMLQNMIGNVTSAKAIQIDSTAAVPIFQLRSALVVVTIGPIVLAYPFVQRYFVKGLTLGATKG